MFKKLCMVLMICFSCNALAMEMPKLCYLDKVPREIQNLIAHFLMRDYETDEEFIERTKVKKAKIIIDDYKDLMIGMDNIVSEKCGESVKCWGGTWVLASADETKLALFQQVTTRTVNALELVIIDKGKREVMHRECIDLQRKVLFFALSLSGNMVASYDRTENWNIIEPCKPDHYNEVKINNYATKNSAIFKFVPQLRTTTFLDFNKQGDRLIIRGPKRYLQVNDDMSGYQLFSLKDSLKDITKDKTAHFETTLDYYFREKGVCKTIIGGS